MEKGTMLSTDNSVKFDINVMPSNLKSCSWVSTMVIKDIQNLNQNFVKEHEAVIAGLFTSLTCKISRHVKNQKSRSSTTLKAKHQARGWCRTLKNKFADKCDRSQIKISLFELLIKEMILLQDTNCGSSQLLLSQNILILVDIILKLRTKPAPIIPHEN